MAWTLYGICILHLAFDMKTDHHSQMCLLRALVAEVGAACSLLCQYANSDSGLQSPPLSPFASRGLEEHIFSHLMFDS